MIFEFRPPERLDFRLFMMASGKFVCFENKQ
jgi:hypothetical protein